MPEPDPAQGQQEIIGVAAGVSPAKWPMAGSVSADGDAGMVPLHVIWLAQDRHDHRKTVPALLTPRDRHAAQSAINDIADPLPGD